MDTGLFPGKRQHRKRQYTEQSKLAGRQCRLQWRWIPLAMSCLRRCKGPLRQKQMLQLCTVYVLLNPFQSRQIIQTNG